MKGFVIGLQKAKNEDMIAIVLTSSEVRSYYRFFGARHSILQLGHLIDFEVEGEQGHFIPRLRGLSQMGFGWLHDPNRLLVWHHFIYRIRDHLKDLESVESFYYQLLLQAALKWERQNPKRVVCESYIELLTFEGRLHYQNHCHICEAPLLESVALMQAFIPAHPECIYAPPLDKMKLLKLFKTKRATHYEDIEIEYLYEVAMKGF
jgi:hypothetical protein